MNTPSSVANISLIPTTIQRGYGGDNKKMLVTFVLCDENRRGGEDSLEDRPSATWSLGFRNFPLLALFDLFAESQGIPSSDLEFRFQGRTLDRSATPGTCGFNVGVTSQNIVSVFSSSVGAKARVALQTISQVARVKISVRTNIVPEMLFFKLSSLFPKIFDFLELFNILMCAFVSTNWHAVTTKYMLLYQLVEGGFENDFDRFVQLLADTNHQTLVVEQIIQRKLGISKDWQSLSVSKETSRLGGNAGYREDALPFSFCKAAGCRQMATCAMGFNTPSFQKKWEHVVVQRTALFGQLSLNINAIGHTLEDSREINNPNFGGYPVPTSFNAPSCDQDSNLRVVLAISQEQCANAISLFRQYFSPDLYFIFPLVVHKLAYGDSLNFCTCTTWCVLDADGQTKAALAWRMHNRLNTPAVAEVLFIATWEEQRGARTGSLLVSALEEVARTSGAEMLYVEVGHEQPLAGRFWTLRHNFSVLQKSCQSTDSTYSNDDFKVANSLDSAESNSCISPFPRVRLEERWHVFFDFHCLRFSDTQQFVKILKKQESGASSTR